MWTGPSSQGILQCFDHQISCAHMSGPLVRSHMNAGQDGFRDKGLPGYRLLLPLLVLKHAVSAWLYLHLNQIWRSDLITASNHYCYRPSSFEALLIARAVH